jgi:hypothetical protein
VSTSIEQVFENQPDFPTISFCRININNDDFNPIILKIQFNENDLLNWESYFESYIDTYYDLCYRFNSGKNMPNQTIPYLKASFAGLGLSLDFTLPSYKDYGEIIVFIHNNSMMSSKLFGYGNAISSGCIYYYYYSVERTHVQKLPQPHNNCFKDVSLFSLNKTIINYIQKKN